MCVLTAARAARSHHVTVAHLFSEATVESSQAGRAAILLPLTQHDSAVAAPVIRRQPPTLERFLALRQGKSRRLLSEGSDSSRCGWQRRMVGGTMVRGGGGSDGRIAHEEQDEEGKREQRMVRNVLLYYPNLIGGC